ncbi:hypothetical protein DL93DRAFT_2227212 [Clavulina sp. PMI_390]|nr:hypothetical protein DL93DRAFT_2227212 [Clavulina sp. PMI_390]
MHVTVLVAALLVSLLSMQAGAIKTIYVTVCAGSTSTPTPTSTDPVSVTTSVLSITKTTSTAPAAKDMVYRGYWQDFTAGLFTSLSPIPLTTSNGIIPRIAATTDTMDLRDNNEGKCNSNDGYQQEQQPRWCDQQWLNNGGGKAYNFRS